MPAQLTRLAIVALLSRCLCSITAATETRDEREEGFVLYDDENGRLSWVDHANVSSAVRQQALVQGVYLETIASRGSSWLDVSTLREANDDATLFEALGFAEGFLTARRSFQNFINTVSLEVPPEIQTYLLQHHAYMSAQAEQQGGSDPYWYAVKLNLARLRGFGAGLRRRLPDLDASVLAEGQPLDPVFNWRKRLLTLQDDFYAAELLRFNMVQDIDEIARGIGFARTASEALEAIEIAAVAKAGKRGHCSGLIKVVDDRVVMGHTTWAGFEDMLRTWKDIRFPHVRHPGIVNRRISMSSYPGYYASVDDWLVMPDSKMLAFETTNDAYDSARLARFAKPESVNTPLRSFIASMMAATPSEWYIQFSRENSGSQNNQWMIFSADMWKKTRLAKPPAPLANVLFVLEQQPGLVVGHDMSELLVKQGYWASYNVATFPQTSQMSGYWERRDSVCVCEAQRGPLFDHAQAGIGSLGDLQALLTTNTWKSAPESWNCPKCAIASRFDLAGFNASIGAELPISSGSQSCGADSLFGSIDAKVTDDLMLRAGESLFVSGPPANGEDVMPFSWETAAESLPAGKSVPLHYGHPSGPWAFPWLRTGGMERRVPDIASPYGLTGEVESLQAFMSYAALPPQVPKNANAVSAFAVFIGVLFIASFLRYRSSANDSIRKPLLEVV